MIKLILNFLKTLFKLNKKETYSIEYKFKKDKDYIKPIAGIKYSTLKLAEERAKSLKEEFNIDYRIVKND